MRKLVLAAATAAVVLFTGHANAEDVKLKAALMQARSTIVVMVKDPTKRDASQQAMVKSSAEDFSKMLAATTPPVGKEAAYKDLSETWAAYKDTRQNEVVQDILAGKQAEAEKVVGGVQKQRYEKMMGIIGAM